METHERRRDANQKHSEMLQVVNDMCRNVIKYKREAVEPMRAIVSEVYSAPRVTDAAKRYPRLGIIPGIACDLTLNDDKELP